METARLLAWYRLRRRAYPWRRSRPDPYHVLVSEFMLQQTQANRVAPTFRSFVARFPSVDALAKASLGEVLASWSGLGYNRRAARLHQAARAIVAEHSGVVPMDPQALITLPGVGPYTASAVAAIAFDAPIPAVDTNVRRVVARAALGLDGVEASVPDVTRAAVEWMQGVQPSVWNQAVMDLGREVCRPVPRCSECPLHRGCAFRRHGRPAGSRPSPTRTPSGPFEGSARQLRGAIIRILIGRPVASMGSLTRSTGRPPAEVVDSVRALSNEGLVRAGPAARSGSPAGRVRLEGWRASRALG